MNNVFNETRRRFGLSASDALGVLGAMGFFKYKHDQQVMLHLARSGVEPIMGTVSRFLNRR